MVNQGQESDLNHLQINTNEGEGSRTLNRRQLR